LKKTHYMTAIDILTKAKNGGYAIGAFNVAGIETLKAVVGTAKELQSPVILEASDGEVKYVGIKELAYLVKIQKEETGLPLLLNLDHGKDFETCKQAIEAGFDYIHFDGSNLPVAENIATAKEVVKLAHAHAIPVEGEIDHIQGSSSDRTKEDPRTIQQGGLYTDPEKAQKFVEQTGVDVFAGFIGNLHGIYAQEIRLDLNLLAQIEAALPHTFLSLHGGSGVNEEDIKKAVKTNVVKINVNSELRVAYKMTLQATLNATNEIAIYKLTTQAIEEVKKVVARKIRLFGSEGKI